MVSFDLIRSIALLGMVMIHVMDFFGGLESQGSFLGVVSNILGTVFAAPVFLFIMGIFFSNSKSSTVRKSLKRGILLMALGYLLNLMRYYIPLSFGIAFLGIDSGLFYPRTLLDFLLTIDLLQFAGLSLIIMGLIKRFCNSSILWAGLAMVMGILSPVVSGASLGIPVADYFMSFLWGSNGNTNYCLFPWLFFPLAGMVFNRILFGAGKSRDILKWSLVFGGAFIALGGILVLIDFDFFFHTMDRMGIGGLLASLGVVLLWHAGFLGLSKRIPQSRFMNVLVSFSKNVTSIYCIHWILIGWAVLFFGFQQQGSWINLIQMIVLCIISYLLSVGFRRFLGKSILQQKK